MDPYNAIQLHKSKFVNSSIQEIHITRQSGIIIRDLFKKLKQGELDIQKVPDITFVGEKGNDAYGLMKEFFTLLMNELTSMWCLREQMITCSQWSARSSTKVGTSDMWDNWLPCQCSMVVLAWWGFQVVLQCSSLQMMRRLQVVISQLKMSLTTAYRRLLWRFEIFFSKGILFYEEDRTGGSC